MPRDETIEIAGEISGELQKVGEVTGQLQETQTLDGDLTLPTERIVPGDYPPLRNKPMIEGNVLIGDKTYGELGLNEITPQEIDEIIFGG